ncbi:MAG: hypothetical protein RJB11_821 [Planctomycetota bacterium]
MLLAPNRYGLKKRSNDCIGVVAMSFEWVLDLAKTKRLGRVGKFGVTSRHTGDLVLLALAQPSQPLPEVFHTENQSDQRQDCND